MDNPIGIFDSGIGGLSVWIELKKQLPQENFIYVADSGNCPYGDKSNHEIIDLSLKITNFLLDKKCKLIVVACNTATAAAISKLRNKFNISFIGMEPAIKPAALNTESGVIGILATNGTFNGELFKETSAKYTGHIETIIQPGIGLVELVENNQTNSNEAKELLKKYLKKMISRKADKIVLGCTHYPFLTKTINKIIPKSIEVVNPAPAIANRTQHILIEDKLQNKITTTGKTEFYSTGNTELLKSFLHTEFKLNELVYSLDLDKIVE